MTRNNLALVLLLAIGTVRGQSVCKNACPTNTTITANPTGSTLTLPINKWVEFCSFTPVPGFNASCSQLPDTTSYLTCVARLCPFLPPYIESNTCGACIANAVPGETPISRIFKCTATFSADDASQCLKTSCVLPSEYRPAAVSLACPTYSCARPDVVFRQTIVSPACVSMPNPGGVVVLD